MALDQPAAKTSLRHILLFFLVLAAISLLAYANSFDVPLQYDDMRLIRFNFSLRDLSNLKDIFRYEPFRPVLLLSFALNFQIGKQYPLSYHVVNLALHLSSVFLFYLLLLRSSLQPPASSLQPPASSLQHLPPLLPEVAAVLMAVHPLNTESVTYIASRSVLLVSVFYFLALLSFDSYVRTPRWRHAAAFMGFFLLGIFTREEAILIPVTALLYNTIFFGADSLRKHRILHIVSFLPLIVAGILRIVVHQKTGSSFPYPYFVYVSTEINVWLRYLLLALCPVGLNVDHDLPALSLTHPWFWVSALVVAALCVLFWKQRVLRPFLAFWGLWFFVNLIPSTVWPLVDFIAEHRVYLSLFGFMTALASIILALANLEEKPSKLITVAVMFLVVSFAAGTHFRNEVWNEPVALWADAVNKSPNKLRPHLNLASALAQIYQHEAAIREYEVALAMDPNLGSAYSGMGFSYLALGKLGKAEESFRKALQVRPSLVDGKTGLGTICYLKGQYPEALPYFEQSYPSRQDSVTLVRMMAASYLRTGRYDEAIRFLQRGMEMDPKMNFWYSKLMLAYVGAGHPAEAIRIYREYGNRFVNSEQSCYETAQALLQLGMKEEAQAILRKVPETPRVRDLLNKISSP